LFHLCNAGFLDTANAIAAIGRVADLTHCAGWRRTISQQRRCLPLLMRQALPRMVELLQHAVAREIQPLRIDARRAEQG
jgi:hypothetical protein